MHHRSWSKSFRCLNFKANIFSTHEPEIMTLHQLEHSAINCLNYVFINVPFFISFYFSLL